MNRGVWNALIAYVAWGLFPIYWKLMAHVPSVEVIGHRIVWSFVVLVLLNVLRQHPLPFLRRQSRRVVLLYSTAALLIGLNWLVYIWAVNSGWVVETSLGYFINPLLNVLLGLLVFRERLRTLQWVAVGIAASGVLYLAAVHGSIPWIALVLAGTFAGYAVVKKLAPLPAIDGLTVETAVLLAPAVAYLLWIETMGDAAFLHAGVTTTVLLAGAGIVTTLPLLLFASAVHRVPLAVMGVLQYIAPTLQFLLGIAVYDEPFSRAQLIGFALVWTGLAVFIGDGMATVGWARAVRGVALRIRPVRPLR